MGKFGDFLSRCEEDVVVLAHTHTWKENEIQSTKNGDVFYLNTGTWIDFANDVRIAKPFAVVVVVFLVVISTVFVCLFVCCILLNSLFKKKKKG